MQHMSKTRRGKFPDYDDAGRINANEVLAERIAADPDFDASLDLARAQQLARSSGLSINTVIEQMLNAKLLSGPTIPTSLQVENVETAPAATEVADSGIAGDDGIEEPPSHPPQYSAEQWERMKLAVMGAAIYSPKEDQGNP